MTEVKNRIPFRPWRAGFISECYKGKCHGEFVKYKLHKVRESVLEVWLKRIDILAMDSNT